MKKIISICTLLLSATLFSNAQIAGNALYNHDGNYERNNNSNSVNLNLDNSYNNNFGNLIEASVLVNVKASEYVAIFSITQHGNTIEEADKMMLERTNLFKKLLAENYVNTTQIFIDAVSLVPTYEVEVENKKYSKTYNETPAGFEIKKNIHVSFKTHELINQIITVAAQAEIYDLVKADYVVDNLEVVLDQLRQEAMRIMLSKKAALEKIGITTRLTQVGEKYGSSYPFERYKEYFAFKTGTPKSYSTRYYKSQREVNYNYAEKNKTIYYEKISDKQFDKVINPVVGEPMVQVYLTLKSLYQIYDAKAEDLNNAYQERRRIMEEKEFALRLTEKEKLIEQIGKKAVK